jgi:hypothetical protein
MNCDESFGFVFAPRVTFCEERYFAAGGDGLGDDDFERAD